jgi:4-hydroxy-2-oxoheptanedioate aldolase
MPAPALAGRLAAGDTIYCGWVSLPEPLVAELVARAGYDCVALEMQHGLHDAHSVMRGIGGIALAGKPSVVRIALGDNGSASRFLDMGAEAIIAPMINTEAEARALVAATKYPPIGERSWGPTRAMALHGISEPQKQLDTANGNTVILAMVETARALAALDAILGVEGIDGVFVGPSDLSVTLSGGERIAPFDAFLDEPVRRIADAATAAGKVAGVFAANPDRAKFYRSLGYRFIALAGDQVYLTRGATELLNAAREN